MKLYTVVLREEDDNYDTWVVIVEAEDATAAARLAIQRAETENNAPGYVSARHVFAGAHEESSFIT